MTSKLELLVKDGLRKKLNTKWFKIVNILLLIVIVGLLNIDSIIKAFGGDFNEESNIYVYDKTKVFYDSLKAVYDKAKVSITETSPQLVKADKDYDEVINDIKDNGKSDIVLVLMIFIILK